MSAPPLILFVPGVGDGPPITPRGGIVVDWRSGLDAEQTKLLQQTTARGLWRKWAVNLLGDAVAATAPGPVHGQLVAVIQAAILRQLSVAPGIVVAAHSFGSVLVSDALWDIHQTVDVHKRVALLTLGSPLAVYALRWGLDAFARPIQPRRWVNIWSETDPLSFPLSGIHPSYRHVEDLAVRLRWGGLPLVGALISHTNYVTHPTVVSVLAELHDLVQPATEPP